MFFPTLILWSVTNLKEPILTLIFSIWIYSLIMIKKSIHRIGYFLIAALTLLSVYTMRPRIAYLLIMGGMIGFFLSSRTKTKKIIIILILIAMIALLLYCYFCDIDIILMLKLKSANFTMSVVEWQKSRYVEGMYGAKAYMIYPEKFYKPGISIHPTSCLFSSLENLYFISKAVILFLIVPFNFTAITFNHAIVFPQILLWYIVLIISAIGITQSLLKRKKLSFFIISYIIVLIIPMALVSSTIGNVFRHRDIFTPFFIIYASYGFYWLMGKLGFCETNDLMP